MAEDTATQEDQPGDPRAGIDHPRMDEIVAAFERGGWDEGDVLPYHSLGCFGCGPDNDAGFGLEVVAGPDSEVRATTTLEPRFKGGPGVAHGGATAAIFDDLLGFVLMRVLVPAVTRELSVTYLQPVLLDTPIELIGRCDRRDGRELHLSGEMVQDGRVVARAAGVFVHVPPDYLARKSGVDG